MKQFDLPVVNDIRKSFYGKVKVTELDNGDIELTSYNTVVCRIHNGVSRDYGMGIQQRQ